ncbi:MAG TPA: WS/DGAT domain-containing protein, partial [Solirubrobacteraceae bacterium]|nr:WS/DGAT domain-containing protein [Solirubrobacteraceae bacterium]
GMGVSIFSYAGGVTVGLQVDAGLVPDPEPILDAFGEELAALATLGRRRRPRARGAAAPRERTRRKPMHLRDRPGGWTVA